ncbi:hypothetical protein CAPTEDRAFT_136695, partial [Capitella teleta]
MTLFVETGLDATQIDHRGASLLHHAAASGLCDVLQMLIDHPGTQSVNQTDKNESTPLHYAVAANCAETTQILLNNGSERNAKDCKGRTAWDLAKMFGFVNIMGMI